ncbi:hypothetical protein Q8W14_19100 [Photobacterium damselae subsp. piscicida]|nr:hypothetical protein [Photobacterium damselae subsp. piscicida]
MESPPVNLSKISTGFVILQEVLVIIRSKAIQFMTYCNKQILRCMKQSKRGKIISFLQQSRMAKQKYLVTSQNGAVIALIRDISTKSCYIR